MEEEEAEEGLAPIPPMPQVNIYDAEEEESQLRRVGRRDDDFG